LGGSLFALNENLPLPELQEAVEWLESQEDIKQSKAKSVLLNMGESFDLGSEAQTAAYVPIDKEKRKEYIRSNLAKIAYDYEGDPHPELEDFAAILPAAFNRFVRKRAEQDFSVQTKVHIRLTDTKMVTLDCESAEYEIGICDKDLLVPPYIYFEMDPKLFLRVLKGPRFAHWNNVEIGAHVRVAREPDIYEKEIHFMLCHFHA
jgi:UDP-MurNAc hydroxylase